MSTTSENYGHAREPIPLSIPLLGGNEWQYVQDCLDTNWVSSVGPYVDRFERQVAEFVGASHAIATSSGTAALHVALLLAGVQPDDEVLVPCLTFVASANAVRYTGAWPVLIDAEPNYWQMDPNLVEDFSTRGCIYRDGRLINRHTRRRVKAVLPVHILGHPVDMDPLLRLARRFDLAIVEDAAESLGACYGQQATGTLGDLGVFSFNGNKTITTGGGGMLVTNDDTLAARARYLTTQAKDHPEEYIHHEIGFNYRLSNVLAALGCAQMEKLPDLLAAKRQIARSYQESLDGYQGLAVFKESSQVICSFWLSAVRLPGNRLAARPVRADLQRRGIQTRLLWQPLHRCPAHRSACAWTTGVASRLAESCLLLPSSAGLTDNQQSRVICALQDQPWQRLAA